MTSVFNLHTVIIYGDTHRTTCIMEQSVTKGIRQGFTQCLGRDLQFFLSRKAYYFAANRKMLEEERHACIKQSEEVSVCSLVVNELCFVISTEAGHAKQKLRETTGVSEEQSRSSIL